MRRLKESSSEGPGVARLLSQAVTLVQNFAELYGGQFEYGNDYTLQQLNSCAPQASPFYCATFFYFPAWGHTFCDNKWSHSTFDGACVPG